MEAAAVRLLIDELRAERLTRIVDVGANPLTEPPYIDLLRSGGCELVGFEPQKDAYQTLIEAKSPLETYFNHAVGDGQPCILKIYRYRGFTSIYEPYVDGMQFLGIPRAAKVDERVELKTVTLDELPDLGDVDLLKIDIQGGELGVLKGGQRSLAQTMAIITERRYYPLYVDEPMEKYDEEIRRQGFEYHKDMTVVSRPLPSSQLEKLNGSAMRDQFVDGDSVYLRDMAKSASFETEKLKHLAILASAVFESHSLVLHILDLLVAREAAPAGLPAEYVERLPARLRKPQ